MTHPTWTEDEKKILREMWRDGYRAPVIGERLGKTESAILKMKDKLALVRIDGARAPNFHTSWDDERIATLRQLWADNELSASQIGRELGISRMAVLGKAHRLGLSTRAVVAKRKPPSDSRPRRRCVRLTNQNGRDSGEAMPLPPVPINDFEIPPEQRRTILQLTEQTCHWPIGDPSSPDFFFCGAKPLTGHPYCAQHSRRAYNFTPATRQRAVA